MQKFNFSEAIESRFPGLIERVRTIIEESEKTYQRTSLASESFLWEHTVHVASLAFRLSRAEERDPLMPVIVALFHDAGKFMGGVYHGGEKAEEQNAADVAKILLCGAGMKRKDAGRVLAALNALYEEKARKNPIADIVHDADFLAKFGAIGIAVFFIKTTLRGRTMMDAVLKHLSRELTYAASLSLNMRTGAGRKLAEKKASETTAFFRKLIEELRESQIADLKIRRIRIARRRRGGRDASVHLIVPRVCPDCGGRLATDWSTEKGLKCEKVNVESVCCGCGGVRFEASFCLPEIA